MMQQAPQIPVTYVYTPTSSIRPSYAGRCSKILGVIQILCGAALFILQVVSIFVQAGFFFVGHGIWTGVFMVIAGAFGVASGSHKSICLIVAHMVMSIIAATFATIPFALSAAAIPHESSRYYYYSHEVDKSGRLTVDSFMLIASLVEIVAGIWASILCCQVCCCASPQTGVMPPGQLQVQYIPAQSGGMQPVGIVLPGAPGTMQVQAQAMPQQAFMYPGPPQQAYTIPAQGAVAGPARGGDSPPPAYNAPPMETKHAHGPQ